jgi:predicted enzyme related to lactoylglutathione lyase
MKNSTTTKKNLNQEKRVGGGRPVAWFEVVGKDGERLRSFFSYLFRWETAEVAPGLHYGVMDASPHGIGGGIGPSQKGPGHVTFFVEVDDLEATIQDVERLGGNNLRTARLRRAAASAFFFSGERCNASNAARNCLRTSSSISP